MLPLYDENRVSKKFPLATASLVVLNALAFFYTYHNLDYFINLFGFSSGKLMDGQVFTIITSTFIHASFWHLLGNMWFLWVFGRGLESRIGSLKLLLLYISCAIGSAVTYSLAVPATSVIIGASGAVSGVLGAYFVLLPRSRIKTFIPPVFLITIPAIIYIFAWFLYQLLSTGSFDMNVAYWAHIGGFLTGMILINFIKC